MALQPAKRHVIPPAVEGERMRRYSVVLMILAFIMLGANYADLTLPKLLWFGAMLLAVVAIVVATGAVMMRGLQWHYDRFAEEIRGGGGARSGVSIKGGEEPAAGAK